LLSIDRGSSEERTVIKQRVRSAARVVAVACALLALGGCGGVLYAVEATTAAARLEEAKELGAERLAPFEYYYAQEHMTKAMEEASQGDYSDALNLANTAEEYAQKAITLSREAHRGAGR